MSDPYSIMAIDGATKCGVVIGAPDQDPGIQTWALPNSPDALGECLFDLRERMMHVIVESHGFDAKVPPIKKVVFEKPLLNQKTPNLRVGRKLYGIAGVIEMVCYELKTDCYEMDAGTWKKVFCGSGRVSKKMVPYPPMVRCAALGWKVNNMDEADACGIWATYVASLNDPGAVHLAGPLFERL